MPEPFERACAPPADGAPPESAVTPSSHILGQRAKTGEVSFDELRVAYVTCVSALTGQNASETARLTGLDRRTLKQWVDPIRLERLLLSRK